MRVRTPLGRIPASVVIAANAAFWPAWTAAVGWAAQRTPDRRFASDDVLTRERPFERGGHWYRDEWRIDGGRTPSPKPDVHSAGSRSVLWRRATSR